jgi:hypothetical protein
MAETLNKIRMQILDAMVKYRSRLAERHYRHEAAEYGVEYVGIFEPYQLAVFQDPVTGSSFAVKSGESVTEGIHRVRERFGVAAA